MSSPISEDACGTSPRLLKTADRGRRNISDELFRTASLEAAIRDSLILKENLDLEALNPQQGLQRLLSTKSAISTHSSLAERYNAAIGTSPMFREIGTGSVGIVFEHPGTIWCYKVQIAADNPKLANNYSMHMRVQKSFDKFSWLSIEVPRCGWYADENSDFWKSSRDRFPDGAALKPRDMRQAYALEHILPLPEPIRTRLIDFFCPPQSRDAAKSLSQNKDCLIRPMLGRRRRGAGTMFFSLRNFRLCTDMMQALEIKDCAKDYAQSIGEAMAVLHYDVCIDGRDVEFVLGSAPAESKASRNVMSLSDVVNLCPDSTSTRSTEPDFRERIICLWLLDFDACLDIERNQKGIDLRVEAFCINDRYCPRPGTGDQFIEDLWQHFVFHYKKTARHLNVPVWPVGAFITGVTKYFESRSQQQPPLSVSGAGLQRGAPAQNWRGGNRGGRGMSLGRLAGNLVARGGQSRNVSDRGGSGRNGQFGSMGGRGRGRGQRLSEGVGMANAIRRGREGA